MKEFENEWYIKQIIYYYNNALKNYEDYEQLEKANLLTVCARAIELTCESIGLVMPLDMFFEWTSTGYLTDYDGHGYYYNINGEAIADVDFVSGLYPEEAVYVAWFNK